MKKIKIINFIALLALLMSATGMASGLPLTTKLSGAEEVPGPGDEDGSGLAVLVLKPLFGKVCFILSADNIEPATAAHIHKAPSGETGPVVVGLKAPEDGTSNGCVSDVDRDLIVDILKNADQYYVNIHNEEFPAGAIRGQLGLSNK